MPFKEDNKELFAYIAGLIDGEGCIYICKEKKNGRVIRYRVRLQITNTNKLLIDFLKNSIGFGYVTSGIKIRDGWKTRYDWIVMNGQARDVLNKCIPYLVIKKQQAELAFQFLDGDICGEDARGLMHKLNFKGTLYAI